MDKKRGFCFKSILWLLIIFLMAGAFYVVCPAGDRVQAVQQVKVTTMDEFYNELSDQIYERDAFRYYEVDQKLAREIIDMKTLVPYQCHYNPDDPFRSGCYLAYYLNSISFSYDSRKLKVLISFPYTSESMDAHFAKLESLAQQLKGKTDYETIVNVHDYLCDNFEYDFKTEMENHTDIDGFRDGVMVCSGYGLAAYFLLNKAGINTRTVIGSSEEDSPNDINHMWNMVELDGNWYNLDITWDDQGNGRKYYRYFLKSDEDFPTHYRAAVFENSNPIRVADKSYKHPFYFDIGGSLNTILYALIGLIIIFTYLHRLNKKKLARLSRAIRIVEPEDLDFDYDDQFEDQYRPDQFEDQYRPDQFENRYRSDQFEDLYQSNRYRDYEDY